jgi:protein gp37
MSDTSKIEWTDATWNPVTGCTKVSQGCKNCYAERLWPKLEAAERMREHWEWRKVAPRPFTTVRCHTERLEAPLRWRKPRRIFVNSLSDLFHEDVPDIFIERIFAVMSCAENHTFQVLTKRPERMQRFMVSRPRDSMKPNQVVINSELDAADIHYSVPWPLPNVWLGVSVEDQATADERIPLLLQTPAAVRFISAEPLLGPIDLLKWKIPGHQVARALSSGKGEPCLHWVIAGGESGPHARPTHPDWIRSLRDQCAGAGVAFFFKQWGEWAPCDTEVNPDERGWEVHPHEETVLDAISNMERGWPVIGEHGREFFRAGKKLAGRHLDGRTHDEYPA